MKHAVAIIDANREHRAAVGEVLEPFYGVCHYDSAANAISGMLLSVPKVILIGQRIGGGSGIGFVKDIRREPTLVEIPIILILENEDFRQIDSLREMGIQHYLAKPYRRSALIAAVSGQLNSGVERSWQDLPPVQRKALEGSLSAFNSLAEEIANGHELPMRAIAEACGAIVDVVNKGQFGDLLNKIKDHDNFTYVHSLRFATFMSLFGRTIGLPREQQILIASGGMLHDIGKMTISRDLLNKSGSLSPKEVALMHGHVGTSERLLATNQSISKGVATIVTQHHERLDGSGYPRGLGAADLNQLARMAAIIDVFCAMTDRRPYRRTLPGHVALETMATELHHQIDQELLDKFKEILLDSANLVAA